jgi:hypothetical protein
MAQIHSSHLFWARESINRRFGVFVIEDFMDELLFTRGISNFHLSGARYDMKSISLSTALSIFLLASMIASVAAQGYPAEVIVVTSPSLVGNSIVGVLALTYPDGTKAVLSPPTMNVRLCGSKGCSTAAVTVNADGSYSISIPQGMTGVIMIYIVAGSMKDSKGNITPSVDTFLGTVTVPGGTPPSGSPPASSYPQNVFRVAGVATQNQAQVVVYAVGAVVLVLAALGAVMLIAPRRNKN